jgi:hypothetical protein
MMKIIIVLMTIAFNVYAQTPPDYVTSNNFYKQFNSGANQFQLHFSDGYKQTIKAPFSMKESDAQPRCPCRSIDFSFVDDKGVTTTRSVIFYPNKETIDYYGADGKKYTVNQLLDKSGNPVAGLIPTAESCTFVGTPNLITIKNKTSCGDTRICYGSVKNCGTDGSVEVSCVATINGECPSAKECYDDPDVIFSKPKAILSPKTVGLDGNKSSVKKE